MSEHPGNPNFTLGRARIWFGPEVEGSVRRGDFTAFINAALAPEELEGLRVRLSSNQVQHVFLTERFEAWGWWSETLGPLLRTAAVPVTLARYAHDVVRALDELPILGMGLMVRACTDAEWVHRLRPGDQVTIGVPYRLMSWDVVDGVPTFPQDYEKDEP